MSRTEGIDTSHWSGTINFDIVPTMSDIIIMKATESDYFIDSKFLATWRASKFKGLYRGHYHFYRPEPTPYQQANHYKNIVDRTGQRAELPPILDVEDYPSSGPNHIKETLEAIEDVFNERPILYTSPWFWNAFGYLSWASQYKLWIARYPYSSHWTPELIETIRTMHPSLPQGWTDYILWQWTASGYGPTYGVQELAVDMNISHLPFSEYSFIRQPQPPIEQPPIPPLATGVPIVSGLRMRIKPNINARVLWQHTQGQECGIAELYQESGNLWACCIVGNKIGWSAVYFNGQTYMNITLSVPTLPVKYVIPSAIRIRKGPGTGYETISYAPAQAPMSVFAIRDFGSEVWVGASSPYGAGWSAMLYNGTVLLR